MQSRACGLSPRNNKDPFTSPRLPHVVTPFSSVHLVALPSQPLACLYALPSAA